MLLRIVPMVRKPTEVRRIEIVAAAMKVLATRGARHFTAQMIAKQVELSPGALFRHFQSMEQIAEAMLATMENWLFEGFPPSGKTPWERLERFFKQRVALISRHPELASILLSDLMVHVGDARAASRVRMLKQRSRQFVQQCLEQARQQGTLSSELTLEAMVTLVLGGVMSVGQASFHGNLDATERLARDVWHGLERLGKVGVDPSTRQAAEGAVCEASD